MTRLSRLLSAGLVSALALGALAAAPATALAQAPATDADAAALDQAIEAAAAVPAGDTAAYVAARERVLAAAQAMGARGIEALAARGAEARFTAEGWKRALVAEAARVRLTQETVRAGVDAPRGLDPERYMRLRKPGPLCQEDLVRLGRDAVPLELEALLWTAAGRSYTEGDAGAKEKAVFGRALVYAPGHLGDARARFAIEGVLRDAARPADQRALAAASFAQCAGAAALPLLAATLDDAAQADDLREACARALGYVPDAAALDALAARLPRTGDETLSRALVVGLGLLGDRWAWEARGAASAKAAPAIRARCAGALVEALKTHPGASEAIGDALCVTAWPASLAAVRALAQDEAAPKEVRDAAASVAPRLEMAIARD